MALREASRLGRQGATIAPTPGAGDCTDASGSLKQLAWGVRQSARPAPRISPALPCGANLLDRAIPLTCSGDAGPPTAKPLAGCSSRRAKGGRKSLLRAPGQGTPQRSRPLRALEIPRGAGPHPRRRLRPPPVPKGLAERRCEIERGRTVADNGRPSTEGDAASRAVSFFMTGRGVRGKRFTTSARTSTSPPHRQSRARGSTSRRDRPCRRSGGPAALARRPARSRVGSLGERPSRECRTHPGC